LEDKIIELVTYNNNRNIRDLFMGIKECTCKFPLYLEYVEKLLHSA
jgi:hypothetical protein